MTNDATENHKPGPLLGLGSSAGLGPLVKPRADVARVMTAVWHLVRSGPNFDGLQREVEIVVAAEIDSAVAAERERWAKAFDAMREKTLAAQSGHDTELANVMLRQLAELGFGECARALRA